jgi:phosphoribosylamine---glycine ligase
VRVLVVGSGGREHALCWALSASPLLSKLYSAPGNGGISAVAECVPIGAEDIPGLVRFAREQRIELVVPGGEGPLVAGLTDAMESAGIPCIGPTMAAARLEGSKSFAKEVCDAACIPTARWQRFEDADSARAFVRRHGAPLVVKADGLAAGKGVVVASTEAAALVAIDALMTERRFGAAGAAVVIEECLAGQEVSFFALCDGKQAVPLGAAQDHKRVGEGDIGPNTGGMGAYAPPPAFTPDLEQVTMERIVRPTLAEMARRGTPFRGVLFAGLMLTSDGPKLIEFNVRLGDPECQVIMLRLQSDLLPALMAARDGELRHFAVRWRKEAALGVVLAARGYPEAPDLAGEIRGLREAAAIPRVEIFHSGTRLEDARVLPAGGRVLTVCATGTDLRQARDAAYAAVDLIVWPEGFCRRDIGWQVLTES